MLLLLVPLPPPLLATAVFAVPVPALLLGAFLPSAASALPACLVRVAAFFSAAATAGVVVFGVLPAFFLALPFVSARFASLAAVVVAVFTEAVFVDFIRVTGDEYSRR